MGMPVCVTYLYVKEWSVCNLMWVAVCVCVCRCVRISEVMASRAQLARFLSWPYISCVTRRQRQSVALGPLCSRRGSRTKGGGELGGHLGRQAPPYSSLEELDTGWNLVGTGCCGDVSSGGWERWGLGQEVIQEPVNEKQRGVWGLHQGKAERQLKQLVDHTKKWWEAKEHNASSRS